MALNPARGSAIAEAHERLAAQDAIEFIGNVEGNHIPWGTADVIVSSGFLGNVVLKTLEGISEVASDGPRRLHSKTGMETWLFTGFRRTQSTEENHGLKYYGGAPLLGFDRIVIKAHGRLNARAIHNALKVAQSDRRRHRFTDQIRSRPNATSFSDRLNRPFDAIHGEQDDIETRAPHRSCHSISKRVRKPWQNRLWSDKALAYWMTWEMGTMSDAKVLSFEITEKHLNTGLREVSRLDGPNLACRSRRGGSATSVIP